MNFQRDQERKHARDAAGHHDADAAGRISASAQLDAPTSPIASGLLQRKARDANGVADDAGHAVNAAASSSGQPLPDHIMRKFESSLGEDLSGVRVHTGTASADAAGAVGAKAYTIGQDIHFGAGQFDPSSSGGEHLLAHEVAHTVQQRGGSPTRQNKLEVSSPHDDAEHEADRAADAMVAGSPFALRGAGPGAARKLARKSDWGIGGKVSAGDGFVKLQLEGSAKYEKEATYLTLGGAMTISVEGAAKLPEAGDTGLSMKDTSGKDGKQGFALEAQIPLIKAEAEKEAKKQADQHWYDFIAPVDASVVMGLEGSDKPGKGDNPTESKTSLSMGVKCRTKSGDSWTAKVQLLELGKKGGSITDYSGPALKGGYDKKVKLASIPIQLGDKTIELAATLNLKPELTIKPNYLKIGAQLAEQTISPVATEVVGAVVDIAAMAGPPLLAAALVGYSIYIAGEKGDRDRQILGGVREAKNAATGFAMMMTGFDMLSEGEISKTMAAHATKELETVAGRNKITVEQLKAGLRSQHTPADYGRIYNAARARAMAAYEDRVREIIGQWRKEHRLAAAFTLASDDFNAIWRLVQETWQY